MSLIRYDRLACEECEAGIRFDTEKQLFVCDEGHQSTGTHAKNPTTEKPAGDAPSLATENIPTAPEESKPHTPSAAVNLPSGDIRINLIIPDRHASGLKAIAEDQGRNFEEWCQEQFERCMDNELFGQ